MNKFCFALIISFKWSLACADEVSSPFANEIGELYKIENEATPDSRAQRLVGFFEKNLSELRDKKAISKFDELTLRRLFDAVSTVQFYNRESRYEDIMETIVFVLLEKGIHVHREQITLQGAYISARNFVKAKQLSNMVADDEIVQVPTVIDNVDDGSLPTTLDVSKNGTLLERKEYKIDDSVRVIIVSHPRCHFTQNAIATISTNPVLKKLFANSLWLVVPDRTLPVTDVSEWNRIYPDFHMSIAYKISEWPEFDGWETPTFYLYKNGKVVNKIVGWPKQGRADELVNALRALQEP